MPVSPLLIGKTSEGKSVCILPAMANRHGLIAGATGTGKTVTLQRLAEQFSQAGVAVFAADVKGDLAGIAKAAVPNDKLLARLTKLAMTTQQNAAAGAAPDWTPRGCPVQLWDMLGKDGLPLRTTLSELGPLLLGRLLTLNPTQEAVIEMAFHVADEQGLLILDLKDLRAMMQYLADNAAELQTTYGNVTKASVGAIQRALLTLDNSGGSVFFGEPALDLNHLLALDASGHGAVHLLDARSVMTDPRLYTTFLLWLLSELFEKMPEAGDLEKPKLVFFFDEAHLLFKDAPKSLIDKVEQVVRLIRSKGVGVYFITQSPLDVPDTVLGQLGHRVQHALRAFTPRDQKAVKGAAETFRANAGVDVAELITQLGVGEALVSVLDDSGRPTPVEHVVIAPPESRIGPLEPAERAAIIASSVWRSRYATPFDRNSAYEMLRQRAGQATAGNPPAVPPPLPHDSPSDSTPSSPPPAHEPEPIWRQSLPPATPAAPRGRAPAREPVSTMEQVAKAATISLARSLGTQIGRGIMGSIFGSGRRR